MFGLLSGSFLSGKLAGKLSAQQTILRGYLIMGVAVVCNLLINLTIPPSLPWHILPLPLYTLGMSLTMPSLTLLALDRFPAQRGLAASCQMFLQSMNNSAECQIVHFKENQSRIPSSITECAVAVNGEQLLSFDSWGRPNNASGVITIPLSGESSVQVCIETEGYIHAC